MSSLPTFTIQTTTQQATQERWEKIIKTTDKSWPQGVVFSPTGYSREQ